MNKFEFYKTMECFGYKECNNYYINDLCIYHVGKYFAIVKGKTPEDLAKHIYNKYDNNKYLIRVEGDNQHKEPKHDIYTYHIDTIEGLTAFILETNNYYNNKETSTDEINNLLHNIYYNILKSSNTNLSIYDWMKDKKDREDYLKSLINIDTYLDFKLRKKIEQFDININPFLNLDINDINTKYIVHGYTDIDISNFSLIDKSSDIALVTVREQDGFVNRLRMPIAEPYEVNVYHSFLNNKESLSIEKYDEQDLVRLDYNISDKTFGEQYSLKHKITVEEKNFIINKLENYNNLMFDINNKNITDKYNNKILRRKK